MLSVTATSLHRSVAPGASLVEQVLVRVEVADRPGRARPDLTAVLVLDVSGSMAGEPIAQVLGSAERVCDLLGDADALGIVCFSSHARSVAPVRRLDARARGELKRALRTLGAEGGTNLGAGIGEAMVACPPRRRHARHVALVMSDGQANEGATSTAALSGLAQSARENGLAISTLGFGPSHDEDVLAAVAEAAGGRYAFIQDPALSDGCFARALGAQRDIVAEDVRLVLTPTPGVQIEGVLGRPKVAFSDKGLEVMLPDAIAPDVLHLVVQLRLTAPSECGPWRPLSVTLRAQPIPDGAPIVLTCAPELVVSRAPSAEVDRDVLHRAAIASCAEARLDARAQADRGNYAAASAIAQRLRGALEALEGFSADDGSELAEAYQSLLDDITAYERHPEPEAYRAYRKATYGYSDMTGGTRGAHHGPVRSSPTGLAYAARCALEPLPPAHLVMLGREDALAPIDRHEMDIGRSCNALIQIADGSVSQRHALVRYHAGAFWLFDLGSTNTTCVNDERLERPRALQHGDVIRFGGVSVQFRLGAWSASD